MKEEMRTIGYLCPACHKRVIQQRSVFALSASGAVVSCECGESSLTIEAEENKFRLSVPCGVCGEEHHRRLFFCFGISLSHRFLW